MTIYSQDLDNNIFVYQNDYRRLFKRTKVDRLSFLAPQSKGLVACWDFSIPLSNCIYDRINGSNLYLSGPSVSSSNWKLDSERGSVLFYAGNNGYYSVTNNDSYAKRINENLTISIWIKKNGSSGRANECVFNNSTIGLYLNYNNTNKVYAIASVRSDFFELDLGSIPDFQWKHITIVFKENNFIGYKDGIQVNSRTLPANLNPITNALYLGASDTSALDAASFYVDDFRIYNRPLSEAEISRVYLPQTNRSLWAHDDIATVAHLQFEEEKSPLLCGGEGEVKIHFNEQPSGQVKLEGQAEVLVFAQIQTSSGLLLSGSSSNVVVLEETSSSGIQISGDSSTGMLFENISLASIIVKGFIIDQSILFRSCVASGRVRVSGKAAASADFVRDKFTYKSNGGLSTLNSRSIFSLVYFDSPCKNASTGFNCTLSYPNKYIKCQSPKIFYGQCRVLRGRLTCPNKDAALASITLCRQVGYLPSGTPFVR